MFTLTHNINFVVEIGFYSFVENFSANVATMFWDDKLICKNGLLENQIGTNPLKVFPLQ